MLSFEGVGWSAGTQELGARGGSNLEHYRNPVERPSFPSRPALFVESSRSCQGRVLGCHGDESIEPHSVVVVSPDLVQVHVDQILASDCARIEKLLKEIRGGWENAEPESKRAGDKRWKF